MQDNKDLKAQEKQEAKTTEEKTIPGKFYTPETDILETEDSLIVYLDMPGVAKDQVSVKLEKDIIKIEGQINYNQYSDFKPLYSEYNLGHYTRSFNLSSKIDQNRIEAQMENGILTITLPKIPEAKPRQINIL